MGACEFDGKRVTTDLRAASAFLLVFLLGWQLAQAQGVFRVVPRPILIPERGEVAGYTLLTETNRFSFLPPSDWRLKVNSGERSLSFTTREQAASATVKITPGSPPDPKAIPTNYWRQLVLDRVAESRIIAEFVCHTGLGDGTAFDVQGVAANRSHFSSRLAFVTFPGGLAEFSLTASMTNFEKFLLPFGHLMTSFGFDTEPPKNSRGGPERRPTTIVR